MIIVSMGIGITKAVSDIVSHVDIWKTSIYNEYEETDFYGPKDKTWIRKDNNNIILNYLYHTILVFVTDIWHFSNMMNNIFVIFALIITILYSNYYLVLIYLIIRMITFHIFYHYILIKHEKNK